MKVIVVSGPNSSGSITSKEGAMLDIINPTVGVVGAQNNLIRAAFFLLLGALIG